MIDQCRERGREAVNDPFPIPNSPVERAWEGAFILAVGFIGLLAALLVALAGLALLLWGVVSALVSMVWRS